MGRKIIITMLIATMFVSVTATSICGAVPLNGSIDSEITRWAGLVKPSINIGDQDVTLTVDPAGDGDNAIRKVNDSLKIVLNNIDNSERSSFVLPRLLFYSIYITRNISAMFPLFDGTGRGLIDRVVPVRKILGAAPVVNSLGIKAYDNISVNMKYVIRNNTFESGEELTLHIFVIGLIPNNINGISEDLPILEYRAVKLSVTYEEPITTN